LLSTVVLYLRTSDRSSNPQTLLHLTLSAHGAQQSSQSSPEHASPGSGTPAASSSPSSASPPASSHQPADTSSLPTTPAASSRPPQTSSSIEAPFAVEGSAAVALPVSKPVNTREPANADEHSGQAKLTAYESTATVSVRKHFYELIASLPKPPRMQSESAKQTNPQKDTQPNKNRQEEESAFYRSVPSTQQSRSQPAPASSSSGSSSLASPTTTSLAPGQQMPFEPKLGERAGASSSAAVVTPPTPLPETTSIRMPFEPAFAGKETDAQPHPQTQAQPETAIPRVRMPFEPNEFQAPAPTEASAYETQQTTTGNHEQVQEQTQQKREIHSQAGRDDVITPVDLRWDVGDIEECLQWWGPLRDYTIDPIHLIGRAVKKAGVRVCVCLCVGVFVMYVCVCTYCMCVFVCR
jgi:hypothetical protein